MGLPQFVRPIPNISGLHGRAYGRSANPWHSLWLLCDKVNDNFETGTLLPRYPITIFPAFTITYAFDKLKAEKSIDDIFLAHQRFSILPKKLLVLISWGRNLETSLKDFILQKFDRSDLDVEIVLPPVGSNCHHVDAA